MNESIVFKIILWMNISLLLLHEMDAVRTMEWKMMIFFNKLKDNIAADIFIGAHFFIFMIILYMHEYHFNVLYWFICIFLIFHQVLHLVFIRHPMNKMNNRFSRTIIMLMCVISVTGIILAIL